MKKIIVFLLSFCSVYPQNFEPGQHQFLIYGNPTYINADSGYFKPDRFILGWQWGDNRKLCEAMKCTHSEAASFNPAENHADSALITPLFSYYSHALGPEVLNARGIQYEPTLYVDPDDPLKLYPQDSEPMPWNFVWGHSSKSRPFEPDSFKQESIFTGFQWSGSKNMNNALRNKARAAVNINLVFTN